ncbi:LysR family transcriptional regulator [Burkholderia cenocepacia]
MDLLAAMRVYARVVESCTMAGAARTLNLAQPVVSAHVARLEGRLGVRLLTRGARELTCTDEGLAFYRRCKHLIDSADNAIAAVTDAKQALDVSVRIAPSHCVGEVVLPNVLLGVRKHHPQLRIDLALNDQIADLSTNGVDVWLYAGALGNGRFVAHSVGEIEHVLVAAPVCLARQGAIRTVADLGAHPFIRVKGCVSGEPLAMRDATGDIVQVPIRTAVTMNHWRPMFDMLVAGGGIGVVQRPACAAALRDGVLVELLPQYTLPTLALHVLVRPQRPLPLRIHTLVEILKREMPKEIARAR